ncbi:MAG: outer membrane beta-barrel protein [Pseudomonadota bacterium]
MHFKPAFIAAAVAAAATLSSGQVHAQEVTRWFGPYAGLSLGQTVSVKETSSSDDEAEFGTIFGAFLGYNLQFRNTVWGLEANVTNGGFDSQFENRDVTQKVSSSYLADLRFRLGYAVRSDTLLSASIGPAIWSQESEFKIAAGSETTSSDEYGLVLGLTVEHLFGDGNIFIRGQWLTYTGFELDSERLEIAGTDVRAGAVPVSMDHLTLSIGTTF